eukprot:16439977-Heterocapsa_arctica.AAC.1
MLAFPDKAIERQMEIQHSCWFGSFLSKGALNKVEKVHLVKRGQRKELREPEQRDVALPRFWVLNSMGGTVSVSHQS